MFLKKRSMNKDLFEARTQLLLLDPEQIHALIEDLDKDRVDFAAALEEVSTKAQNQGKIQQGATGETMKGESVALGGDAVEFGQALTHIGGDLGHVVAGALGPLVAGAYVFKTYRGIAAAVKHIHHLKHRLEEIEAELSLPAGAALMALPPAPGGGGHGH